MKYYKLSSPIKIKIDIYSVVTVIIQSVDFAVFILNVLSFHFPTPLPVVMATAGCRNHYKRGTYRNTTGKYFQLNTKEKTE